MANLDKRLTMKIVPLGGAKAAGRVALVDDEDYDLVMQYRWNLLEKVRRSVHGLDLVYARSHEGRNADRRTLLMHKLLTGWAETDHVDHNGLNNQRHNLRDATKTQNRANQRLGSGYYSQFKGVSLAHRDCPSRWRAYICGRHLGTFHSEVEAALAYDAAARVTFGEFAQTNFPHGVAALPKSEPRRCAQCRGPMPSTAGIGTYYCSPDCHAAADAAAVAITRHRNYQNRLARDAQLDARIVALRDGEGASWAEIGRALGIKGKMAQAHYLRRSA